MDTATYFVSANDVTAICAVLGVAGAIFLFSVNAIIGRQFNDMMARIEKKFASRVDLSSLETRVERLEDSRLKARAHAGGD